MGGYLILVGIFIFFGLFVSWYRKYLKLKKESTDPKIIARIDEISKDKIFANFYERNKELRILLLQEGYDSEKVRFSIMESNKILNETTKRSIFQEVMFYVKVMLFFGLMYILSPYNKEYHVTEIMLVGLFVYIVAIILKDKWFKKQ